MVLRTIFPVALARAADIPSRRLPYPNGPSLGAEPALPAEPVFRADAVLPAEAVLSGVVACDAGATPATSPPVSANTAADRPICRILACFTGLPP